MLGAQAVFPEQHPPRILVPHSVWKSTIDLFLVVGLRIPSRLLIALLATETKHTVGGGVENGESMARNRGKREKV